MNWDMGVVQSNIAIYNCACANRAAPQRHSGDNVNYYASGKDLEAEHNWGVEIVNDVSAKEIENYYFSRKGCKFQAGYDGKLCKCWNNLF